MPIVDRPLSAPERLGVVGVAVAGAAVVWPVVSRATGFGLPCPLRSVTGLPCPLCGMTTASQALVRGDFGEALAANPFLLVLATLAAGGVVALALRAAGWLRPPAPWGPVAVARCLLVAAAGAALSEAWQLHRTGWL